MNQLRMGTILSPPEDYPAPIYETGRDGEQTLTKFVRFADVPASAFITPPPDHPSRAGTVRVAFFGGSTTYDGYPEEVQKRFDQSLGPGHVNVVNMGLNAASSATALTLMRRYVPVLRPHVIVYYDGFNDLAYERAWAIATYRMSIDHPPDEAPAFDVPAPSRGLLDVWRRGWDPPIAPPLTPWLQQSVFEKPRSNYAEMSRLAWSYGARFVVQTFARPGGPQLSPEFAGELDENIHFLWPVFHDRVDYATQLDIYNEHVRSFAAETGDLLVEAAGIRGGAETFVDNCHFTDEGKAKHAEVVFQALRPLVAELLASGAPPAQARPKGLAHPLAAAGWPGQTGDGHCVRGPCPEDMCFVPAGEGTLGASKRAQDRAVVRIRAGIGFGDPQWFEDEGDPEPVRLSPFCIDRTEATESSVRLCRESGACPPYHLAHTGPAAPAILPTYADAEAYCAWRESRLPTDAEWEWAARGPKAPIYPWGDDWTGREANFCGSECPDGDRKDASDGFPDAAPTGTFHSPGPFGTEDQAGNLWEWVADCFDGESHARSRGVLDPRDDGPGDPVLCRRFMRGGSYASYGGVLERRDAEGTPDIAVPTRGVRCVRDFGTKHAIVSEEGLRK